MRYREAVLKEDGEQRKTIGRAVRRRGQSLNDSCDCYWREREARDCVCVCV